jgi:hypothetical protein
MPLRPKNLSADEGAVLEMVAMENLGGGEAETMEQRGGLLDGVYSQ